MAWVGALIPTAVYWAMLAFGSAVGVCSAYARERNDGKHPNGTWWWTRAPVGLLLMIITSVLDEKFDLSDRVTLATSAILSLWGFEALRLLTPSNLAALLFKTGSPLADAIRAADGSGITEVPAGSGQPASVKVSTPPPADQSPSTAPIRAYGAELLAKQQPPTDPALLDIIRRFNREANGGSHDDA